MSLHGLLAAPAAAVPPPDLWKRDLEAWCNPSPSAAGSTGLGAVAAQLAARLCLRCGSTERRSQEAAFLRRIAVDRILQCVAMREQGTVLSLAGLQLTSLPPGLHRLTHLEALDVSDNRGLRALPEDLARCVPLRHIRAKRCALVEVPTWIGHLQQIQSLDFTGNPDLHTLPAEIGRCLGLKSLKLRHCDIFELPQSLGALVALRTLDVEGNRALRELPASVDLDRVAVAAAGTNLALLSRLFKEPDFDAATKADLTRRIEMVKAAWTDCRRMLALGGPGAEAAIEQLQRARMRPSYSVREDTRVAPAWIQASQTVKGWAAKQLPLTVPRMLEINRLIWPRPPGHALPVVSAAPTAAAAEIDIRHPPLGVLRTLEVDADPGENYVPGRTVKRQLAELIRWYERTALLMGPDDVFDQVRLVAMLGQRLVSIHPFNDGNGRTARLVMDWLLQRHGLPPAPPAKEATWHMALFSSTPENRPRPEKVIQETVENMEWIVRDVRRNLEGQRPPV